MYYIYVLQYCTLGGYWKFYTSKQEICIVFMYWNTVLLEAIENFILANKRYVLNLCTAILYSWRLMKYCGGHNFPNNNVNTVTLFLMYWENTVDLLKMSPVILSSVSEEFRRNSEERWQYYWRYLIKIHCIHIVIKQIIVRNWFSIIFINLYISQ